MFLVRSKILRSTDHHLIRHFLHSTICSLNGSVSNNSTGQQRFILIYFIYLKPSDTVRKSVSTVTDPPAADSAPLRTGYFCWRVSGGSHLTPLYTAVGGPRSDIAAATHHIPHKLLQSPITCNSLFCSATNLSCAKFPFLVFYPYFSGLHSLKSCQDTVSATSRVQRFTVI